MKPAMRTTVSKLKKGTTMKKIDWDNLEYYDFIGFVGIAAFLIYALYVGTLWYVTYDYRIQTRGQIVEMYQQISDPIHPIKNDYGVEKKWLTYSIFGTKEFERDLTDDEFDRYGEQLLSRGWKIDKKYTEIDRSRKSTTMLLSKGEFVFEITRWDEEKKCSLFLVKEDWIYNKGF